MPSDMCFTRPPGQQDRIRRRKPRYGVGDFLQLSQRLRQLQKHNACTVQQVPVQFVFGETSLQASNHGIAFQRKLPVKRSWLTRTCPTPSPAKVPNVSAP